MRNPRGWAGIGVLLLAAGFGCNTSRYGINHDQRLPGCRRIAIVPLDVQVLSWHAGGGFEAEPDLVDEVRPRLLEEIGKIVADRDRSHVVSEAVLRTLRSPGSAPDAIPLIGCECSRILRVSGSR